MDPSVLPLREQVMINQFVLAAGCDSHQAEKCLAQADWQFQVGFCLKFKQSKWTSIARHYITKQ